MINHKTKLMMASLAALLAAGAGCRPIVRSTAVAPIPTPQQFTVKTIGYSVQKRPIDLYSAGYGSETILIIASIHGNEQAGTPLVYKMMEHLRRRDEVLAGRRILIVPTVNPDGVALNTRGNSNGIDLNRNFQAFNRENSEIYGYFPLSEPESRILYDLIAAYRPIRIVSIHQPLKCIDYDGPAQTLASFMAVYCPLPVKKLGARPGSFGAYAGEHLSIPIITLELERSDDNLSAEQLWVRYGMALMASITYPNYPY